MGTKLRALYQRKKGRDLFDLHKGLTARECNVEKILECYRKYMEFVVDRSPSYKEFAMITGTVPRSFFISYNF